MNASFCCRVGEAHGTWAFQTCLTEALLSHVSVVARLLLLNQNAPSRVAPEFAACTVPQSNIMEVVRHVLHRGGSRPPKSYSVQCFIVLPQHLQLLHRLCMNSVWGMSEQHLNAHPRLQAALGPWLLPKFPLSGHLLRLLPPPAPLEGRRHLLPCQQLAPTTLLSLLVLPPTPTRTLTPRGSPAPPPPLETEAL